jgi:hypothetical protein
MVMADKYTEKDAAAETESSKKEVAEAWHTARDDAASAGDLDERNDRKVSDSPEGIEINKALHEKP